MTIFIIWNTVVYRMVLKMRKMTSPLSPVAISFLSTHMWYHFWTNQLLAFSRGFQWSARAVLRVVCCFSTRAKFFKKLIIPIVNVVKWKKNKTKQRNDFQIRGCYWWRANTDFRKNTKGLWIIITVLFIVSASLVEPLKGHYLPSFFWRQEQ